VKETSLKPYEKTSFVQDPVMITQVHYLKGQYNIFNVLESADFISVMQS